MQLQMDARRSLRSAYAAGSFENLNTQWVTFLQFCICFELQPFPATTILLVWYSQFLSRHLAAHASIVSYLSGVKTLHTLVNFSIKGFHGFLLKLTLRGLRRDNQHVIKRAQPMTPALLRQIHHKLNHTDPIQAVFWGICVLAFMLLFRKSNLVPDRVHQFNPRKQLRHADVIYEKERKNIVVGIRWAKNHQFSKELLTFPLPVLPGSVLCPVTAVMNIRKLIPHQPQDHLFKLPDGSSFTYRRFHETLRRTLNSIGVEDSGAFSSHSFRRGGCTFSFLCGIPIPLIKLLGNWSSDCFMAYLEFPLETRTAACELIKFRLLALEK